MIENGSIQFWSHIRLCTHKYSSIRIVNTLRYPHRKKNSTSVQKEMEKNAVYSYIVGNKIYIAMIRYNLQWAILIAISVIPFEMIQCGVCVSVCVDVYLVLWTIAHRSFQLLLILLVLQLRLRLRLLFLCSDVFLHKCYLNGKIKTNAQIANKWNENNNNQNI